uniref:Uncharacterized protein n=1 Tax=Rhizophora mucronata TaxID=61149 RepID=A0A2P2KVW3_RHIMU
MGIRLVFVFKVCPCILEIVGTHNE